MSNHISKFVIPTESLEMPVLYEDFSSRSPWGVRLAEGISMLPAGTPFLTFTFFALL